MVHWHRRNQRVTPEDQVKAAIEQLSGIPLMGVILNRTSSKVPGMTSPPDPWRLNAE